MKPVPPHLQPDSHEGRDTSVSPSSDHCTTDITTGDAAHGHCYYCACSCWRRACETKSRNAMTPMNQITKGIIASLSCPKYLANASGLTRSIRTALSRSQPCLRDRRIGLLHRATRHRTRSRNSWFQRTLPQFPSRRIHRGRMPSTPQPRLKSTADRKREIPVHTQPHSTYSQNTGGIAHLIASAGTHRSVSLKDCSYRRHLRRRVVTCSTHHR